MERRRHPERVLARRREDGPGTRVGPDLIAESHYTDLGGGAGHAYRLLAVNGLREELEIGRLAIPPAAPLVAWPLPCRGGPLHISFAVASAPGGGAGRAEVEIFDLSGRRVRSVSRGSFDSGYHAVVWDGRDEGGVPVAGGIYFLRATTAGQATQLKVLVIR